MAGVAGRSGGARTGAGRKPLREKFTRQVEGVEKVYAAELKRSAERIIELAGGGAQRVEVVTKAAGTLLMEDVARDGDGNPVLDRGRPVRIKRPIFPDVAPETMIEVERTVTELEPSLAANEYITNRILGKPIQAVETEMSGPDGGSIPLSVGRALDLIYGDGDPEQDAQDEATPGFED